MKRITTILIAFILLYGCSGSSKVLKDYRLNLEFRTEDNKAISDEITITMIKDEDKQTYTTTHMNYTIDKMYTLPFTLKIDYKPNLYKQAIIEITESDIQLDNQNITKKIEIPIKKTRFYGAIMDDKGLPVIGATVTIEDVGQCLTGDNGLWELETFKVAEGSIVTVRVAKKSGNFDMYRSFSRTLNEPIKFQQDNDMGTFNLQELEREKTEAETSEIEIESESLTRPKFGR
jgi:hypothetical protein